MLNGSSVSLRLAVEPGRGRTRLREDKASRTKYLVVDVDLRWSTPDLRFDESWTGVSLQILDASSAGISEVFTLGNLHGTLDVAGLPSLTPPCTLGILQVQWQSGKPSGTLRLENVNGLPCANFRSAAR